MLTTQYTTQYTISLWYIETHSRRLLPGSESISTFASRIREYIDVRYQNPRVYRRLLARSASISTLATRIREHIDFTRTLGTLEFPVIVSANESTTKLSQNALTALFKPPGFVHKCCWNCKHTITRRSEQELCPAVVQVAGELQPRVAASAKLELQRFVRYVVERSVQLIIEDVQREWPIVGCSGVNTQAFLRKEHVIAAFKRF